MTLSSVGSLSSRRDSAEASSEGWGQGCVTSESVVDIAMFLLSSRLRSPHSRAQAIEGQLRNNEAEAHRQNIRNGGRAVGDCRAQQLQSRMRAACKQHKAARHSEQEDARY